MTILLGDSPGARHRRLISPACLGCGTRFRTRSTKLAEAPGTKLHKGGGLCAGCYKGRHYAKTAEANYRNNQSALRHYIHNRRQRGIPPEGLPVKGSNHV